MKHCLCQDCLEVYPFTLARHQEDEFCSCGGQLCGCSDCDDKANSFVNITDKSARVDLGAFKILCQLKFLNVENAV